MEIIDAQLHCWTSDDDIYPWDPEWRRRFDRTITNRFAEPMPPETLLGSMDAVGVDRAVLVSPGLYGADYRYALDAADRYPGRFAVIAPLSPYWRDVEERITAFASDPNALGFRLWVRDAQSSVLLDRAHRQLFSLAEQHSVPIQFLPLGKGAAGCLETLRAIARRYPNLLIVLAHLGLNPLTTDRENPDTVIAHLVELSAFDNIAVACTAAPQIAKRPYPFPDIWPYLHRVIEAFGPERVMWGSDITAFSNELTYRDAIDYMRQSSQLSRAEKTLVLGGALRRLLNWPSPATVETAG